MTLPFDFRTGSGRWLVRNIVVEVPKPKVKVELDNHKRIGIWMRGFDIDDVEAVKRISGRRFDKGHWTVPQSLDNARKLRDIFGRRMTLGPNLRDWAAAEVKRERKLKHYKTAIDAKLLHAPDLLQGAIDGKVLPIRLPHHHPFRKKRPARPYQRADIKFMAEADCINGNDVGTGKTLEQIGALFESGVAGEPILIVAPRRTLVSVWQTELERFTAYKVWASEQPAVRQRYMNPKRIGRYTSAVCVIADDIRLAADRRKADKPIKFKNRRKRHHDPLYACNDYRGNKYRYRSLAQKRFLNIKWGALIVDEFHNTGINNRRSLFYTTCRMLRMQGNIGRLWLHSATPIGGKARRLWPVLNLLYPKQYSSEWQWIEEFLEVEEEEIYKRGGGRQKHKVKRVGDIKDEARFHEAHSNILIRRTKLEALPGLPQEVHIEVETPMLPSQHGDYNEFDRAHELVVDGKRLSGAIVLAQYTRLRQLANSKLTWDKFYTKPIATRISGKIGPLLDKLEEHGIRPTDYEPQARAYIGVNDVSFAYVIYNELQSLGVEVALLTGKTKDSAPILRLFDSDLERPFVIVMTTKTGGTGLNLERANSAHLLDEPWDPDVSHQFFGRGNRGARTTPLKCYTYRTPDSIQEYIAAVAGHKKLTNKTILDYVPQIEEMRRAK